MICLSRISHGAADPEKVILEIRLPQNLAKVDLVIYGL